MNSNRLTEFVTVLLFAMAIGAATMLAVLHLSSTYLAPVLVFLVAVCLACWQYLRKRFRRR